MKLAFFSVIIVLFLTPSLSFAEEKPIEQVGENLKNEVKEKAEEATLPWLIKKKPAVKNVKENKILEIVFSENNISLTAENILELEKILAILNENPDAKIVLKSFSGKQKNHLNEDRRESLNRAIEVRKYFIEKGIDKIRINVMALGNSSDSDIKDRLEIIKL